MHDSAIESIWFCPIRSCIVSLDRDGKCGVHRYVATMPMTKGPLPDDVSMPFTIEASERIYKQPVVKESACRALAWAESSINISSADVNDESDDYDTAPR